MAEIISTGIERLDEALIDGKGIVLGTSMLIEGSSGSGKELLAKQYASAGVGSENVVYFSTDETFATFLKKISRSLLSDLYSCRYLWTGSPIILLKSMTPAKNDSISSEIALYILFSIIW